MKFSRFEELCDEQQVRLHHVIIRAGRSASSGSMFTLEPNGMYSAVNAAGNLLRKDPEQHLASAELDIPEPLAQKPKNFAANVLSAMIAASINPVPATDHSRTFICRKTRNIDCCSNAEGGFSETFTQMYTPQVPLEDHYKPIGYQIITGSHDEPIAVRKARGEPSALTLVKTTINGIPYPAGSIMRMDLLDDRSRDDPSIFDTDLPFDDQRRVGAERVSHAAFIRLSAFSERPKRRKQLFDLEDLSDYYKAGKQVLAQATMRDLTHLAATALQYTEPLDS